VQGSYQHRDDTTFEGSWNDTATIQGRLSMPLYQRGEVAADVRQFKETLGQRRIDLDATRAQVRQVYISSWGMLNPSTPTACSIRAPRSA
jgi:outer membrane protein